MSAQSGKTNVNNDKRSSASHKTRDQWFELILEKIVHSSSSFNTDASEIAFAIQEEHSALVERVKVLEGACQAALKYDEEIHKCANDPDKMSTYCSATGDTLDTLYDDWITKARAALGGGK